MSSCASVQTEPLTKAERKEPADSARRSAARVLLRLDPGHGARQLRVALDGGAPAPRLRQRLDCLKPLAGLVKISSATWNERKHCAARHIPPIAGLNTIEVDTTMTVDEVAGRVTEAFGL
jgi:hypothetical protein